MDTRDLKGLFPEELEAFFAELDEPPFRARQLFQWIYRRGVAGFDEITVFSRDLRRRLEQHARISRLQVLACQEDPGDDTVKLLLGLADGVTVEGVLLAHDYGLTACLSSQVGCRWACTFCASAIGGRDRDLSTAEIVDQFQRLQAEADRKGKGRISNLVMMGIGEPLDNYDAVLKALRLIHHPQGLDMGYRRMTISTCGLVPGIKRLAGEELPLTLAVSLHAPNDYLRDRLMPVNRRHPLSELIPACREYAQVTGRRVTFEYALMADLNDFPELARELAILLRDFPCHVNLIPLNPVPELKRRGTTPARARVFLDLLRERGVNATLRKEMGASIDAACGQLRRRQPGSW